MGKLSGGQKNLANCSATSGRSSGIILLSNLQKVIEMFIFQTHHLLENKSKIETEKKKKNRRRRMKHI
jgi:hypothetical protein